MTDLSYVKDHQFSSDDCEQNSAISKTRGLVRKYA